MKDYSQFGEGKIIADAVAAIEKHGYKVPKVAVEFGAGDGYSLSNIRGLLGWHLLQIEKEAEKNSSILQATITAENVNTIPDLADPYKEIGVISIDVDGSDYWIWRAMSFNPDIVCIEYNPTLRGRKTIPYDPNHHWTGENNWCGCSFLALLDLGHRKGYKAIAKTHSNVIFVRADLWPDPEPEMTHEPIFVWPESGKEWQEV